jgi:hypothetical protein
VNTRVGNGSGQSASEPGRPTKYTRETVERLLAALADGLTQKQACLACSIGESTLWGWKKERPELVSARTAKIELMTHRQVDAEYKFLLGDDFAGAIYETQSGSFESQSDVPHAELLS